MSSISKHTDTRYILLDSTYRDRYLYPEASSYTVPFQKAMGTSLATSVNPLTQTYPKFNFQWSTNYLSSSSAYYNKSYFSGTIVAGTAQQPVLDSSIDELVGINNSNMNTSYVQAQGIFRQLTFYYNTVASEGYPPYTGTVTSYIVCDYDPIARTVTLDSAIPSFVIGTTYVLYNPSYNSVADSKASIVLQAFQLEGINATSLSTILSSLSPSYSNNSGYFISSTSMLYLWDVTINEIKRVVYNDNGSLIVVAVNDEGRIQLDDDYGTSITSSFSSSWSITDSYILFINNAPNNTNKILQMYTSTLAATFSLTLNSSGSVTSVSITYSGSGYVKAPSLYVVSSTTTPSMTAVLSCTINTAGEVDSVSILSAGYGYSTAGDTQVIPAAFILPDTVARFSIQEQGIGYTTNDIVGLYPSGSTVILGTEVTQNVATMQVVLTDSYGQIKGLELLWPGYNYCCGCFYDAYVITPTSTTTSSTTLPCGTYVTSRPNRIQRLGTVFVSQVVPYLEIESETPVTTGNFFLPLLLTQMFGLNTSSSSTVDQGYLQISPTHSLPPPVPRIGQKILPELNGEKVVNGFYGVYPILKVFPLCSSTTGYGIQVEMSTTEVFPLFDATLFPYNSQFLPISQTFAILDYEKDGVNSLDYSGSTVSSNQPVCYGIKIVSLILPNQILNTSYGGLTSSYPFVFVEISNETSPLGNSKNTIYSNNPNSTTATFSCHVSDVNSPLITKFIKIFSDGNNQVIKFKPNDNLKFRLFMPNGDNFVTTVTDYLPPLQVNPLLQISCLIEITRLG